MKKLAFVLFFIYAISYVKAQVVLENNPSSIQWQQINTKNFRVIFPKGFDLQGQRMANTLEHIRDAEVRSLKSPPRKLSVILQNQSSESNGFASILPRRSEFFTMPPQDYNFIGTNDWLNLLATHEYRHVVQYQHATRGFNKFIYYLFGSTTLAGFSQAAVPQWFWEGDAVTIETALTPSGRGRIPHFSMLLRTNLLEGRTFNYHKQYLRSYKHNISDHYELGYYMVSHLRRNTQDPEIWDKITARAWTVPLIPFTFSNAIRRETGLYVTDLFDEMATALKKDWQAKIDDLTLTPFENLIHRKSKAYTDFLYPQPLEDGTLILMKKGIGDIEQFVVLNGEKKQHKIFTPGFVNDAGMLSVANNKVAWAEYGFDPRWGVRNYSQIKVYNLSSHFKKTIGGRRARLSGAALSPDGNTIVAVESNNNYTASLQLFDVARGNRIKTFPNPENVFYSMPRWSADGKSIIVIKTDAKGKRLCVINSANGTSNDVLIAGHENVGHPVLFQQYIFFSSPITGIDNIFMFDMHEKKRYQVTSSKHGAYNPSVSADGKTIYYNEQGRDGLDVVRIPFNIGDWKIFSGETSDDSLVQMLVAQEGNPQLLDSVPQQSHPVTNYSKLKGIFNPYSWGTFVTNDLAHINIGIASRDILSTTAISAGYMYDINEGTSSFNAGLSYQGFYPILDLSVLTGERVNDEKSGMQNIEFKWRELTAEGGVRIPLQLTNSKYSRQLSIGNAVGITRTSDFRNIIRQNGAIVYNGPGRDVTAFDSLRFIYKDQLNNGDLIYNRFNFSMANLLKRSRRDFLPRWGQTLDVDFYNTPYGGDFKARLFAAQARVYFPGFFKHHFLYARFAYQESFQGIETNTYIFRNRIAKPRGHSYPATETFAAFSINYALPLWYPDIALGPILNIQRVKTNLFYDHGKGTGSTYYYRLNTNRVYSTETDEKFQSLGFETTFDFNVMRFLPKFELGFRTVYRFANAYNNSGVVFEVVVGNIAF